MNSKPIWKNGEKWSVEELEKTVHEDLLGKDYAAPAKAYGWEQHIVNNITMQKEKGRA